MKSLKWVTIITFAFSVLSLTTLIVFFLLGSCWDLGYDISLAVLGSALLGFIISITQYFAEKRKSMEMFYLEALSILNTLQSAKYFELAHEKNIIFDCIVEEYQNNNLMSNNEVSAKNELIREICKDYPSHKLSENDVTSLAEERYSEVMKKTFQNMEDCMKKYISISQTNLRKLDDAYGGLDFIFANSTIRRNAFERIYSELRSAVNNISEKADHFKLYFDSSHPNKPVMFKFLLALNDDCFSYEVKENEYGEATFVFFKLYDDIMVELEKFRSKIYRITYSPQTPTPIITYQKYKKELSDCEQ